MSNQLNNFMRKTYLFCFVLLFIFSPYKASAVMQSLNGLTGQNQTFANDTNVRITSAGTVHTLGWNGLLSPSRGGAGVDLSAFRTGSLLFWDGSKIAETLDNGYLIWDEPNQLLHARSIQIDGGVELHNGAQINFYNDDGIIQSGIFDTSSIGQYRFGGGDTVNSGQGGILDFSQLSDGIGYTSYKTFTFPDATGTFSLLQSNQNFSGINTFSNPVNNFISSSDSTVHIGADGIPGCIVMGDSDSSGVTYVTANDGVLSASTTPPANCN